MRLVPGANPRSFPGHRERGPKQFVFTYEDFAELFGMSVGAVYQAVHRKQFDPTDLTSVVAFADSKKKRRVSREQAA